MHVERTVAPSKAMINTYFHSTLTSDSIKFESMSHREGDLFSINKY